MSGGAMTDYKEKIRSRASGGDWESVKELIFGLETTTAIEDAGAEIGDSEMIDFLLNVRGVDELSSSRLSFRKEDARLEHGSLRAGEVDLSDGTPLSELEGRWVEMLEDAGLDFDSDYLGVEMREVGRDRYVPHVIFGNEDGTSPVSTERLVSVIKTLPRLWNDRTGDLTLRGRVSRSDFGGQESTTGTVDDMLDNL